MVDAIGDGAVEGSVLTFGDKIEYITTHPKIGKHVATLPYAPGVWIYLFEYWTATGEMVEEKYEQMRYEFENQTKVLNDLVNAFRKSGFIQ